jgi:hypothetical protein
MAAATYYFEINQGETFDQEFVWADSSDPPVPYDLTGWTVRFQARSESGVIILDTGGTPTSGLSATISALLGKVTVSMTPACTSAIPCPGRYAIELTQTSGGRVKRLVEGSFTLSLETNR